MLKASCHHVNPTHLMRGFVVGLTGGMATGKTTLAGFLRCRGAAYYSVDEAAHALYRPGLPAYREVLRVFGRTILALDGSVDRTKLGARVFQDPAAMKQLSRILHPRLRREVRGAIRRLRHRQALTVVEAGPLLFVLGLHNHVDLVVLMQCRRSSQIRRLCRAKGLQPREAQRRIKVFQRLEASLPRAVRKVKRALIVTSAGPPERLKTAASVILGRALR